MKQYIPTSLLASSFTLTYLNLLFDIPINFTCLHYLCIVIVGWCLITWPVKEVETSLQWLHINKKGKAREEPSEKVYRIEKEFCLNSWWLDIFISHAQVVFLHTSSFHLAAQRAREKVFYFWFLGSGLLVSPEQLLLLERVWCCVSWDVKNVWSRSEWVSELWVCCSSSREC